MKSIKNKKNLFIIVFLLVVSSTIAFLYSTDTFQNIFVAASYKVVVTEEFVSPDNWTPGDETDKTVTLKNEGTVPIKVRIKFEEEWKDSNNQDLPLEYNGENVSIINFDNEDDYIYKDGYYYYDPVLNPGETTSSIIKSVTFNPNYSGTITCEYTDDYTEVCSSSESGYEGGTYKLKITIEGVQEEYYVQAWGLTREVEQPFFYNILKYGEEDTNLVQEYTGSHNDSINNSLSSNKIYYYHSNNTSDTTEILNNNNVIFGDICWNIVRTTDTGGIKLLYNGEAVDGKCLDNRGKHFSLFPRRFYYSTGNNLWFGSDFTYDSTTNKYSIAGEKVKISVNPTTYNSVLGYYTCHSSSENATCDVLYRTGAYKSDGNYYDYYTTDYKLIGQAPFSYLGGSFSYLGYMYGDVYTFYYLQPYYQFNYGSSFVYPYNKSSSFSNYWFADQLNYVNDTYSLKTNIVKPSSDYSNLVGKYTLLSTDSNAKLSTAGYVFKVENNYIYYKIIKGETSDFNNTNYYVGDSINYDHTTGIYTIVNPTLITINDIEANGNDYVGKYTCPKSNSCLDATYFDFYNGNYIFGKSPLRYYAAKSRSGNQLIDTTIINTENVPLSTNYSDYKYICTSFTSNCPSSDIEDIIEYSASSFYSATTFVFGSDVSWDGEKYTLVDAIDLSSRTSFNSEVSNHHYFCPDNEITCTDVRFAFYHSNYNQLFYLIFQNGKKIDDVLSDSLENNVNESFIKQGVDFWFENNLINYVDYLDDVVYCNNRTLSEPAGFSKIGDITKQLRFGVGFDSIDFSCEKQNDQFSVSNNSAKLKYPVGLLTKPETNLLKNRDTVFYSMSPYSLSYYSGRTVINLYEGTNYGTGVITDSYGVRPAVTLKSSVKYSSGDGSMANPYIVKMN